MGMELTNNNNKLPLEPYFSNMSDPNVVVERRTRNRDRTTDFTDFPLLTYSRRDQSRSKYKSKKRRRRRSFSTSSSFKPASPDFAENRKSKDPDSLTRKEKKIYIFFLIIC